jgi:hypothetical protein
MDKRIKAVIQGIILLLVMLIFVFPAPNIALAAVSGGMALVTLCTGLFFPKAFKKIEALQSLFAKAVSAVLTAAMLVPFYYLCFTIGRLIVLLSGKDPMERRFPDNKPTYWQDYAADKDPEQYTRQY